MAPPKQKRTRNSTSSRASANLQKTEVTINVYDLLPMKSNISPSMSGSRSKSQGRNETTNTDFTHKPSTLSTILWTIGSSLHHSGVAISSPNKEPIEYAYGGHPHPNKTGVYHTPPLATPPEATFRCSILHGISFLPPAEIDAIVQRTAAKFMGRDYDLLSKNCNHFTSELCFELTGRKAPGWLNRAAGVGLKVPCVVPKEWIGVPEAEDEELVDEDRDWESLEHESEGMLSESRRRERQDVRT